MRDWLSHHIRGIDMSDNAWNLASQRTEIVVSIGVTKIRSHQMRDHLRLASLFQYYFNACQSDVESSCGNFTYENRISCFRFAIAHTLSVLDAMILPD
jgi:hypothetical protein